MTINQKDQTDASAATDAEGLSLNIPAPSSDQSSETAEAKQSVGEEALKFSKENPLVITRMQTNEKGGLDYVLSLSKEQTYILLQFAIMFLMQQGLVMFATIEQVEETAKQQEPTESVTLGTQLH